MTDGRKKGKVAEREVAALIQEWWRLHEATSNFVRTPMSGGWVTGTTAREGFQMAADLMTDSHVFPFSVEIKRREGWSFERFRDGKPSPVRGWWQQTRTEARTNKRVPMLWLRKSRQPWLVILPEAFSVACWEQERARADARGLPPVPWLCMLWGDALCFKAEDLLARPPDYYLAGSQSAA